MNIKYKILDELMSMSNDISGYVANYRSHNSFLNQPSTTWQDFDIPEEVFRIQLENVVARIQLMSQLYEIDLLSLADSHIRMSLATANSDSVKIKLLELSKAILKVAENVNRIY